MSSQFGEAIAKTMLIPKMIATGTPIPPQWQSLAPSAPASQAPFVPQRSLGPAPAGGASPASGTSGAVQQRNMIMSQSLEQPFTQTKLGQAKSGGT